MTWVDGTGFLAATLVFTAFCMKTMIPLRYVAIGSNFAFITFGYFGDVYPVLVLHMFLLPLNIFRLVQMRKLISDIKESTAGEFSLDSMMPYMRREQFAKGETLFRKGDKADKLYLLQKGSIRLPEIELSIGEKGAIIGEMGIFSPDRGRTTSAVCETDLEALVLTDDKVLQLYFQNPKFGFYLVQMIIHRMVRTFYDDPSG